MPEGDKPGGRGYTSLTFHEKQNKTFFLSFEAVSRKLVISELVVTT